MRSVQRSWKSRHPGSLNMYRLIHFWKKERARCLCARMDPTFALIEADLSITSSNVGRFAFFMQDFRQFQQETARVF